MKHCDDYIEDATAPKALRDYLEFNRRPAIEQMRHEGEEPALFARHDGKSVRVVMASRFGDVGISDNLKKPRGYSKRVAVEELTDFSAEAPRG